MNPILDMITMLREAAERLEAENADRDPSEPRSMLCFDSVACRQVASELEAGLDGAEVVWIEDDGAPEPEGMN